MSRVTVVWSTPDGDKILDRIAAVLRDQNGWNVSARPDPKAKVNFFPVYVTYAQEFTDWHRTPIAAYFSHYEPDQPYKKLWWDTAAELVDYKIVTADQYGKMLSGNVYKVPAPLGMFHVLPSRNGSQLPKIGTSGFVYATGRKGENLLARLAHDFEGKADVVASGEGWPVKHVNHDLKKIEDYYHSLNFYVCTSLIEGIPMGPLEALACGVPVIIPEGVGMLDELPDVQGIYRYKTGDYDALKKVTEKALKDKEHDQEKLAATVEHHSEKNFAKAVRMALEGNQKPQEAIIVPDPESDRHGQRGVLYVAYGEPARKCAVAAIHSFKKFMPDIPVALVSDSKLGPEDIFIKHPDEDIGGRSAKTQIYKLAPKEWQYVLYLDSDTEIIAPVYFLFDLLSDGWDMTICKNPGRFHVASQMVRGDNKDECDATFRELGTDQLIQLNGGVFAFQRNQRTQLFFESWHKEWKVYGKRDQAALLRSLSRYPLKIYVLGVEWNLITRYDPAERSAGILHYPMTARRWRGVLHDRSDSEEAWRAVKEFESK